MNIKKLLKVVELFCIVFFSCRNNTSEPENNFREEEYFGQIPPGLTPLKFVSGVISAGLFEYKLLIRPNSNEVYYEIWNKQTQRSQNYVLKWVEEAWSDPKLFLPTNSFNEEIGCFSADGQTLFYSSNEPKGGYAYDIKYLTWENNSWSSPKSLGTVVNSSNREQSPSISSNGNLYYYSEYNGSTGIFMARWENNAYQQPIALSDAINSTEAHNPFIASDESFIIFSSYRAGGMGDADLYISIKSEDGSWSDAKNFETPVNTTFQDDFAFVSPDGKYLFFASDRESNGMTDIYWISIQIIENFK